MTTIESLSESVARRLRGKLAERKISQTKLRQLTGWSAMYVSRRVNGETALDMADLETIQAVTGIDIHLLLPRKDSNLQPAGLRSQPRYSSLNAFSTINRCDDERVTKVFSDGWCEQVEANA